MPWQTGMTGLVVRKDLAPDVTSICDLFDPQYAGKVEMLTEMRDTVPLVMKCNGVDLAKATEQDWLDAIAKIQDAVDSGQIRRFTGNDYARDLASGDAVAVIGWSGDAVQLQADDPNIEFRMPEEGCMLWSDNMVIPIGAPNPTAAEAFMNYVYDPVHQAQIEEYVNYVSPVAGTKEVLLKQDPEIANNKLIFPPDELHQDLRLRARDHGQGGADDHVGASRRRSTAEDGPVRKSKLTPYLLLAPGLLWLIIFFVVPLYYSGKLSLYGGASLEQGFSFDWDWSNFSDSLSLYDTQFLRSFLYAGIATDPLPADRLPGRVRDRVQGRQVPQPAPVRGRRPVLHHVPDPDPRLGDDPLRREPGGELPADDRGRRRRRSRPGDGAGGDRRAHIQLLAVHDPAVVREPRARRHPADRGRQRPLRELEDGVPQGHAADHRPGHRRRHAADLHPGDGRLRQRLLPRRPEQQDDRQHDPVALHHPARLPDRRGALVRAAGRDHGHRLDLHQVRGLGGAHG